MVPITRSLLFPEVSISTKRVSALSFAIENTSSLLNFILSAIKIVTPPEELKELVHNI